MMRLKYKRVRIKPRAGVRFHGDSLIYVRLMLRRLLNKICTDSIQYYPLSTYRIQYG